jgi:hypothetical protein
MSEKPTAFSPVELTRRAYEALSRRHLDVVMRDCDDDSVFDMSPAGLGSFQGVAAILEDWIGAYEEYEVEPEQILDLGSGVVLAVARQNARLAHGTGSIQMHHGNVFVWEEDVIARVTHNDPDQARAAAERLAE